MPRASKQQARYAVGRCLMLWSSNDVTQQGSRPKTKLAIKGVKLKISLISAVSENGVIGSGPDIPWSVKGEQNALKELSKVTDHVYVSGGGQIYNSLIEKADIIHLSTVHVEVEGDIKFPIMPENFNLVFEQFFMSNINYTYQIWKKG